MMAGEATILFEKYGATEIGQHTVGSPVEGATEPPVVDLTAAERERATEEAVIPVATPIVPGMPNLPGPIGR
jgi:hypothetical protein